MSRLRVTVGTLALALVVAGCTDSPHEQGARERKAAGVRLFRIHCTRDLWNRTGGQTDDSGQPVSGKIADEHNGLVTVDLTGPNLVDLLRKLDYRAHGGNGNHDPLAIRMYNAIAPEVDKIQSSGALPGGGMPEVTINDSVGGAGQPTPTPTPSGKSATPHT